VKRAVRKAAESPKVQAAAAAVLGTAAVVTAAVAMNRADESKADAGASGGTPQTPAPV
jgi:hypothetical protein